MLDELVKAKTDLETKIISFNKRINEILEANNNLESKLESSNAKIICLEAMIEAHETKIADLEAQKENVTPTVDIKPEIGVLNNLNGKRPHVPDNNDSTNKRIKKNDCQNLKSSEQPKDVERVLNILSLASNLKEFLLPALTSDPKWNLEVGYIPDFSDIEVNETNFVMECTYGSLHPMIHFIFSSSVVKVYQNPNIPGFARVDCEDKKAKFIYSFDSYNNKIRSEGMFRYSDKSSRKLLARKTGKNYYSLSSCVSGEIIYKNTIFIDGKHNVQCSHKFDPNSLVWSKHQ